MIVRHLHFLFSACVLPSSIEHGSTTATGNTITSGQSIVLTCDAATETREITCTDGTWDPELTCPGELQGPGESVLFIVVVSSEVYVQSICHIYIFIKLMFRQLLRSVTE